MHPELKDTIPTCKESIAFLYFEGSFVKILIPVPYELSSTYVKKLLNPSTVETHKSGALICYWITCILGSQLVSRVG